MALARSQTAALHSRPVYHGWYVALACGLPAIVIWVAALTIGDQLIESAIIASLPQELRDASGPVLNRFLADAETLAKGGQPAIDVTPALVAASERFGNLRNAAVQRTNHRGIDS